MDKFCFHVNQEQLFRKIPPLADHDLVGLQFSNWEKIKNEGNTKLKSGDFQGAIQKYTLAAERAKLPFSLYYQWLSFLMGTHARAGINSPVSMLHNKKHIIENISVFFRPSAEEEPPPRIPFRINEAAAICYGNRSLAHFRLQQYKEAVHDANLCLRHFPTYVKGHYRKQQALNALYPDDATEKCNYFDEFGPFYPKVFKEFSSQFLESIPSVEWEGHVLVAFGLIPQSDFELSRRWRERRVIKYLKQQVFKEERGIFKSMVGIYACLISFPYHIPNTENSQVEEMWLSLHVRYYDGNIARQFMGMKMHKVCPTNGSFIANGFQANNELLNRIKSDIISFASTLRDEGMKIREVILGQGLMHLGDKNHEMFWDKSEIFDANIWPNPEFHMPYQTRNLQLPPVGDQPMDPRLMFQNMFL